MFSKMERDFMGLAVKRETPNETIDAAPVRSVPMQWSFSNKGSALPQLLSFKASQEEKPKSCLEKNVVSEGGVRYTMMTSYNPTQHVDTNAIRRPNQTISPSVHHSFLAASGKNPLGLKPVQAMPSSSPVVGTTDLRNSSKISTSPTQLTIFFNGSVCVYDNISPEKAQAIMLLAGNGPPTTSSATPPIAPLKSSIPMPYPAPHRSSPVPVASFSIPASAGSAGVKNDGAKPAEVILSSSTVAKPLKAVTQLGSVSAAFLSSGTVPQFRGKSLARFLEKRKERVVRASPYGDKQSPDCNNHGGGDTRLIANSSGPCPVTTIN